MEASERSLLLTDEQESELQRLARFYWREAEKCEEVQAYFPGCLMLSAWAETVLILFCDAHFAEISAKGILPLARKGARKPVLEWTFLELLRVAKAFDWAPDGLRLEDTGNRKTAKMVDYAEVLGFTRNLIRPAACLREHPRIIITARHLTFALEASAALKRWLERKNAETVPKRRHAEERH